MSDGSDQPFRFRIHDPSFMHLSVVPRLLPGNLLADTMAIVSSLDPVMGGVDR
jgi:NADH-quinone oxidoreductase subunit D